MLIMLRPRLVSLLQVAFATKHNSLVSSFSSLTSRAKKRCGYDRDGIRLWSDTRAARSDGGDYSLSNEDDQRSSHILSIKSSNIAGIANDGERMDVNADFGPEACLVAVTGESGSGKSLLISKAIDLVTGGKAVASLVPPTPAGESSEQESASSIELTVNLYEPQLSAVSTDLQNYGIDPQKVLYYDQPGSCQLLLKRTLTLSNTGRLKSVCTINGKHISLKTLRHIAAPLFTRVDAGVASSALGLPTSRMTMLDMGVPESLKRNCAKLRDEYKAARKRKESIKQDLESRILPSSLQGNKNNARVDEEQVELMKHWVDELDSFEIRISRFQDSVLAQYNEWVSVESSAKSVSGRGGIVNIIQKLQKTAWGDIRHSDSDDDDSLLTNLLDFREAIKALETQCISAHRAYESLASLTAPNSASVALENTRKLLYDVSSDDSGPLFKAVEKTHELLNDVVASLNECARSIDGNSDSLLSTLEKFAFTGVSIEEVDNVIADWNVLARKHGISPYSLPDCHMTLREELDGNIDALQLLPQAEEEENIALQDYSRACKDLSNARKDVASQLSESVTNILPSLGLEGSAFRVQLSLRAGGFEEPYCGLKSIGVDIADFLLLHQKHANGDSDKVGMTSYDELDTPHGGQIEQVGSSGEKSRVLLAIETVLPGSIGSVCNSFSNSADNRPSQQAPPISIIYDEIDAHVGGRAAVTMAKLLADQSRRRSSSRDHGRISERGSQIIAITHSASLAAIADRHLVVERGVSSGSTSSLVQAYAVNGSSRRKEIARMASGDLASGEAETFADALIRDALLYKETPAC